ncbi:hypothetical protein CF326_g1027 [Tilletia indica]|nr:hypothetical protein CF326_g1027 [Tilletia indica]
MSMLRLSFLWRTLEGPAATDDQAILPGTVDVPRHKTISPKTTSRRPQPCSSTSSLDPPSSLRSTSQLSPSAAAGAAYSNTLPPPYWLICNDETLTKILDVDYEPTLAPDEILAQITRHPYDTTPLEASMRPCHSLLHQHRYSTIWHRRIRHRRLFPSYASAYDGPAPAPGGSSATTASHEDSLTDVMGSAGVDLRRASTI